MTPSPLTSISAAAAASSSSSSSQRRFGSFVSGAISSAASPLQANFNLSCRSPIWPSHDGDARRGVIAAAAAAAAAQSGSPFLEPPSIFPLLSTRSPGAKVVYEGAGAGGDYGYEDGKSISTEESPTDQTWFLQPSPGLPPARALPAPEEGKLGVVSAINIIVGKTVGVGAYSVPSAIFDGVGSVGMTLLLWVLGSLISFCGLAVYLDLGTAMPRSGGERVYLERIFRRPYMLATCMFMSYVVLLGFSTPNAIVLGEYALYALDAQPNRWNVRAIAVAAVTLLCYVHARHPRLGLRLINVLGVAKMLILVIVVLSGIAGGLMGIGADRDAAAGVALPGGLLGARRLDVDLTGTDRALSTAKRNFSDIWAGSSSQPYDYATALLKVVYCFRGYSTANQVLSDVRDPVRTLRVAAPIALSLVSLAYLAINVAFFLVVDKDDFRSAGVVVAGIFFRNVFGPGVGAHVLPLFVIISAAGNIAATSFAQARVNEELAKDGLLPWARFWSTTGSGTSVPPPLSSSSSAPNLPARYEHRSSSPTKNRPSAGTTSSSRVSPSRGLLLHWLVSAAVIVLPPPGRIYNFLVDMGGYPVSVISVAVSAGLLYLHATPAERWVSPAPAPRWAVIVFAAGNCLLLLLPWVPPAGGRGEDAAFAYYAYPASALAVLACGAIYWCWWRLQGGGRTAGRGRIEDPRRRKTGTGADRRSSAQRKESAEEAASGLLYGYGDGESLDDGEDADVDDGPSSSGSPMVDLRRRAPCGCVATP